MGLRENTRVDERGGEGAVGVEVWGWRWMMTRMVGDDSHKRCACVCVEGVAVMYGNTLVVVWWFPRKWMAQMDSLPVPAATCKTGATASK